MFRVGRNASFDGMHGITNDGQKSTLVYDPASYLAAHGDFAYLIYPTAFVESGAAMANVNTYDSARFTFGFFQFAAHVANGDFVRFFRSLLNTPGAQDYFPDLSVDQGNIFRTTLHGKVRLEDSTSTAGLMSYLNPSSSAVEDIEVINAAKFIDWTQNSQATRDIQVDEAVETAKRILKMAHNRIGLRNRLDTICLVIMDIFHQGRGGAQSIINALQASNSESVQFSRLLRIGSPKYDGRLADLRKRIDSLTSAGHLGTKRYRDATNDFA